MSTERRPEAERGDGLFIVGLVGQAGSGKTTVARALEEDGAVVISADALGHQVTDEYPDVRAALSAEYGADVYGPNGLDRRRVAAAVFRDRSARERLDRLVHPKIVERLRGRLRGLRAEGWRGVVVIDAALMLEWKFERECDAVITVTAPRDMQIERLMRQRGWDRDEAERRLAAQRAVESLAAAADVVLDNRGRSDDLERAAREAVHRLRAAAHSGRVRGSTC
jgi:dephospho-CoA kinase